MKLYSVIRTLADQQNVSISRIERNVDISNGSICKWNNQMPGADKLQLVADYLGVTSQFILNKAKEVG